jgi:hypothetical protein
MALSLIDWAHESAQQGEGPEGSWVHAYLHRKEGDQGNAVYWYGRAGKPVCRQPLDRCGMAQHRERFAGIDRPPLLVIASLHQAGNSLKAG